MRANCASGQLGRVRPMVVGRFTPVVMEPWLGPLDLRFAMSRPAFRYEQPERFGESLPTARPWNRSA